MSTTTTESDDATTGTWEIQEEWDNLCARLSVLIPEQATQGEITSFIEELSEDLVCT